MKNDLGLAFFRTLTGKASCLSLLFLLATTVAMQAEDYACTTNSDNTITITRYIGPGGAVTIPSMTNGLPVTSIWDGALFSCTNLTSVMIGNSVTNIGAEAFGTCASLKKVCFRGNAPSVGLGVFDGDDNATVYYLDGTTGWGPTFGGCPTAVWKP
jgi:hypothetical protein